MHPLTNYAANPQAASRLLVSHHLFLRSSPAVGCLLYLFLRFLPLGEICIPSRTSFNANIHLTPHDITVNNKSQPSMFQIRLKQLKTDQFHEGPNIVISVTGQYVCPVAGLFQYLTVRAATTAASTSVSDAIIMSMGRWNSMAYAIYVHTPREVLVTIPQQLSTPKSLSS